MALGREHVIWRSLAVELLTLVAATDAVNAVVLSAADTVVCRATNAEHGPLDFHQFVVTIDQHQTLMLWFDEPFDEALVTVAVNDHIAAIESLTERLPE